MEFETLELAMAKTADIVVQVNGLEEFGIALLRRFRQACLDAGLSDEKTVEVLERFLDMYEEVKVD